MAFLADGFVALPGGFGTLEELLEIVTWHQLGFHSKPIEILNVGGFFNSLLRFFDESVQAGFISENSRRIILVSEEPGDLLDMLAAFCAKNDRFD